MLFGSVLQVGEVIGARLMAHSGSLLSLSKQPASTIQILGAEKALFRALKTKSNTPKYGIIYHAALVGQAPPKLKGISSSACFSLCFPTRAAFAPSCSLPCQSEACGLASGSFLKETFFVLFMTSREDFAEVLSLSF